MDEIKKQVAAARRRLVLQQFLVIAGWSLFACLLVSAIGLAIPKIWAIDLDARWWTWGWIGGGLLAGIAVAVTWTLATHCDASGAARELDRRYQLKERVASAWGLTPEQLQSEAGQALLDDAVRQVSWIDVRDQFSIRGSWKTLLPLLPALVIFALIGLVPDASDRQAATASTASASETEQVNRSARQLQKRLARAEQEIREKNLVEAEVLLKELRRGLEDLTRKDAGDRKDALVKLNELSKQLEERRNRLGGAEKVRQQLNQLKNLQQGPADKIAQAMKQGDFAKAMEEIKQLQDKLAAGDLDPEAQKQLAEQLQQMQDKLNEMVDAHREAKQKLQDEIDRCEAAGDMQAAGKLQRQLDQLNALNDQMGQLEQMANNLGDCKDCLQNGDSLQAAEQLSQVANQLAEMQRQLDELETLDEMMSEIGAAKDSMNCQACDGEGCQACQGQGQGGLGDGFGLGEGQGRGERPEQRGDTGAYESQVRAKLQPGEAVRAGYAGGPNRAGRSKQDVKELIQSNLSEDADPLMELRLPRKEREHAKEYFQQFRE